MPSVVALVDSLFATVRSFQTAFRDFKRKRGVEIADKQPESKDQKLEASVLSINSKYVNRIIAWLRNDEISTIGIHGMGGIGKTTLTKQLHTQILSHDILSVDFDATAWVSVGINFTVYQLQQKISYAFGLSLQNDKDVNRRAAILYALLSGLGRCILFLDDLWGDFRREDVGIPKQCKLVLVSRLLDVCRVLHCQKVMEVESLSEEETWQLFQSGIGYGGVSCSNEGLFCQNVVYQKCAGLPLAITALANNMKQVDDPSRWKEVLESMDPISSEDVTSLLKLSYERLNSIKLQQCFLHSASYLENHVISREELIRLWIKERLIDDVPSLQAQYDMGHTILNKLLNSCLLEACEDKKSIRMHNLVRRMAVSISREIRSGEATKRT